ncbi:MAG: STY4528 family pathogenicity island replication protein [Gammaproteobacteria bacterium]|nr:STY4528 family pathogenicity island replication protein [Gammaproteobacteria bacterium]
MADSEPPIRPETRALDTYIQATVDQLLAPGLAGARADDSLLFLGNWHDAMPRLIFQDPVLQPVDTRIWGVIKIAAAGSGPTAFPTYKQIARTANVGSEATVARAMAILRATRWLTLCRRVRDGQGRFRGNVYALHDEPLPLADTIHLDQAYLQFLHQCLKHAHAQVRKVATAVLGTTEDDVQAGRTVTKPGNPLDRRLSSVQALQDDAPASRFFSVSAHRLQKLKSEPEPLHEVKSVGPQNLKCVRSTSSSCSLNKTTTTTTTPGAASEKRESNETAAEDPTTALIFPDNLNADEHGLARMYLRHAPGPLRQDILDEFAGRLRSADKQGAPIRNPVGYLARLCQAAAGETFKLTSLGLEVQEAREQETRLEHMRALSRERGEAQLKEFERRRRE